MPKPFSPRRATCGRCGGSGVIYEWEKDRDGKPIVVEKRCTMCGGSGVR